MSIRLPGGPRPLAPLATTSAILLAITMAAPPVRAQQPVPRDTSAAAGDSARQRAGHLQQLERVTVTAVRGGGDAPISQKTLGKQQIEEQYFGQDVPLVLQGQAPSITAYAETGNYWGYSYLRLRGMDQSRINLTIDGIPLNDPEDQVLYFADFPDLANSVQSVQVQRGVGTSTNGTAAYAGSISFETIPLATTRSGGSAQLEGGSWGTRRASVEYQSGLLPNRFAFYGRVSSLGSEGYRYHSAVRGRSAFLSAGYFGDRDIVKLIATAGELRDTMAYLAVPESALARDRRLNPLDSTARDGFGEQLVALSHTRLLAPTSSISTTVYRISSNGDYDVPWGPDIYNYGLKFAWYGLTSTWSLRGEALRVDAGVNANDYARDHSSFLRPDGSTLLYLNTGHKRDASGFAKLAYDVGALTLFGDLQARWAEFRYTPSANADIAGQRVSWRFLNPKVGATWRVTQPLSFYASYGSTGREPARSDMFAGYDNLDTSNVAEVGAFSRVRPERVHDTEAGARYVTPALQLEGNLFDMEFRHEIAPIGALTANGTPLRKNVPRSWRRGVELDASWRVVPRLTVAANATLMRGRIDAYTDDASGVTYYGVEPLLTPRVTAGHRVLVDVTRALRVSLDGHYTSASHLDNTGDRRFLLPASYVADANASWRVGRYGLSLQVNNLGDSRRYGSGYVEDGARSFYVLPPRNVLLTARVGF